ncbi:hypothetical protein D3C80_1236110 [compost metagenome]
MKLLSTVSILFGSDGHGVLQYPELPTTFPGDFRNPDDDDLHVCAQALMERVREFRLLKRIETV